MKLDTTDRRGPLWRKLLWFVAIWLGSVTVLTAVAFAIRLVLKQ
ncbi:DUF2474 family protein [Sphingobium cupriresistens]|uniref:DUF2474 domain-containing protein n=1 Tax=Sphingobium cupriresistens TaxID=1132417 RepID=A0A8G1ZFF5_9SPHN|nr:DUF2474 family protein [Sphingobium cupriresistens]RYM10474.1 DUF2474 domain-containing protein [Sphingobium cupriresistens]